MRLNTNDLVMFAALAELGGVTAAARKLGLQKSTVSRELARLEERLGQRLLQRTTRRVALTDAGELLAAYARRVVEELENAESAMAAMQATPRGDLRVSVSYSFLRFVLAPRLAAFQERYPEIRLALDPSLRVVDLLEEGVDVAIRIGSLPSSSLVARKLGAIPLILVASPDYIKRKGLPARPEDLAHHAVLDLRRALDGEPWTLSHAADSPVLVPVRPQIAVADPGLMLDLAEAGLGIAAVPDVYAAPQIADGRLLDVLPGWSRGAPPIHAVYLSRRVLAPKIRVFLDFLADAMREATAGACP